MTLFTPQGNSEDYGQLRGTAEHYNSEYSFVIDNSRREESHLVITRTEEGYTIMPFCGTIVGVYEKPRTPESKNLMPSDSSVTLDAILEIHPRFTE